MPRILVAGVEGMISGAIVKRLCGVRRVIAGVAFTDVGSPGHAFCTGRVNGAGLLVFAVPAPVGAAASRSAFNSSAISVPRPF